MAEEKGTSEWTPQYTLTVTGKKRHQPIELTWGVYRIGGSKDKSEILVTRPTVHPLHCVLWADEGGVRLIPFRGAAVFVGGSIVPGGGVDVVGRCFVIDGVSFEVERIGSAPNPASPQPQQHSPVQVESVPPPPSVSPESDTGSTVRERNKLESRPTEMETTTATATAAAKAAVPEATEAREAVQATESEQAAHSGAPSDVTALCRIVMMKLRKVAKLDFVFGEHTWDGADWGKSYLAAIPRPIAFVDIEGKIDRREYRSVGEFSADLDLIKTNCLRYNTDVVADKDIRDRAKMLSDKVSKLLEQHCNTSVDQSGARVLVPKAGLKGPGSDAKHGRTPPVIVPAKKSPRRTNNSLIVDLDGGESSSQTLRKVTKDE